MAAAGKPAVAFVKFHVNCSATKPGQAVFICGGAEEFGAWDAKGAVPCITTAQTFPQWTSDAVEVPLAAEGGKLEFKVILQAASGTGGAKWEGGPNRVVHLPKSSDKPVQITCECAWGKPEVSSRMKRVNHVGFDGTSVSVEPPAEAKEEAQASPPKPKARGSLLEPGVSAAEAAAEAADVLQPLGIRKPSRFERQTSPIFEPNMGMRRSGSRHLVLDDHGLLNRDMSRTPSMMLIDMTQMSQDCDDHIKELEALEAREEEISKERERERLNSMQRRMPSGSLLEAMKEITDFADKSNVVLLQGFNWESWRSGSGDWYGVVTSKVGLLEEMGITDVWLPPPSQSVAPQGYLPSRLFDLDGSQYGTQASLESLIKALHQAGIRAVADIVVNHRCGDKQDSQGRWNQFSSGMTSRPSFAGVVDWGGWAITLGDQFSDGTGQNAPGAYDGRFDAAPDIDHRNKSVQDGISIWLRWLRLQVGFDAWRFDFVKGYSAEFVGLYCKKSHPAWAVGELWCDMEYDDQGLKHPQDKHRQDTVNWINGTDKTCTAFDFTTKGILQEAVRNCQYWRLKDSNGKPPGLIGWMPKHAVTFIDNHDTGSTQRHWPFPDDKVLVGYAYIISHPGLPSIFWDHVMDWGEDHRRRISEMLKARRESGMPVDAKVTIQCADRDLYLAEVGSPPALRVALGPRGVGQPDMNYWREGCSGRNYHIWVRKESEPKAPGAKSASAPAAPPPAAAKPPAAEVPAEAPAAAPPAAAASKAPAAAEAPAAEAARAEPAAGRPAFEPVVVDGQEITEEVVAAMAAPDLERLCGRLEPPLRAARRALEGASGKSA